MSFLTFSVLWTLVSMFVVSSLFVVPVIIIIVSLIELFIKFLYLSCKKIYFKLKAGVSKHER
ncbi:hypothetical protein SAMN02745151_01905 [[Clostridium] propionicum DSM 1682]|uniref:Uncharacterized protein n=1 Tax=Anaerotignum propionicum DSM 1682 TaxID=991789 RepID=A0A120MKB0_ANAPI|nr:hypothetical protein CPRO_21270 [Anaerotignum propionicum DSM 1682]SHE82914.1 hypothetical protein SAMN02745151_01905 [[Clostridium] propionicum DSM 1682] [Anaerotignum propionicum DSM 1682]